MNKHIKNKILLIVFLFSTGFLSAQDISVDMQEYVSLSQIYGETYESDELLPMNEVGIEFGYALYTKQIEIKTNQAVELVVENVRDYAAVYINNVYKSSLTSRNNRLSLDLLKGVYNLQLYVENIGRITYGPEILDNSKGIFGQITLHEEELTGWEIIPLNIRECNVGNLTFSDQQENLTPQFHKGYFTIDNPEDKHLDITGWGMGEVWINDQYLGAYWEEEVQKSLPVSASILKKGENEVVIFDLKHRDSDTIHLMNKPVFK